jgi:hypothetical protein
MTASQVAPAPGSRAGPARPPCLGSRAAAICRAPTADTVSHPQAERHRCLSHNRGRRRKQGREQLVQYRGGAYVLCGSPLAEASLGMRELGSRRAECRSPIRSPAPGCPGACTWLSVRRFCIASYPRLDRGLDAGWRVLQGHLSTRLRLRPRDATGVRGRCGRCAGRDGQDRAGSCRRCRIGRGSDSRRS